MGKSLYKAVVIKNELLATGIHDMLLECQEIAAQAVAGQFINIYCNDNSRLLPRPISICDTDAKNCIIRIVFRIAGEGTKEFSKLKTGDTVRIMGPLGNGFPLDKAKAKKVMLIGGGIGIPPMLNTVKSLKNIDTDITIVNGYRNNELFLKDDFELYGEVHIATEDGSSGIKGNVLDVIKNLELKADIIFACGPTPMLKAIKNYATEKGIEAYISLEEKMACGIGACLACVCKSKDKDEHTNVNNKRICKEGPVFNFTEIELD